MKKETIKKGYELVQKIDALERQINNLDKTLDKVVIRAPQNNSIWWSETGDPILDTIVNVIKFELQQRLINAKVELENLTDNEPLL